MNLEEKIYYYMQDAKRYKLMGNAPFQMWYQKNFPNSMMSVEDVENLIDSLAFWYEIKYPNKDIQKEANDFSSTLTYPEFYKRFVFLYPFLNGDYEANNYNMYMHPSYKRVQNGYSKIQDEKNGMLVIPLINETNKWQSTRIFMSKEGLVEKKANLENLSPLLLETDDQVFSKFLKDVFKEEECLPLQDFYNRALKIESPYNLTPIKTILESHEIRYQLRETVFALAAEKMLFNRKSTPEENYLRVRNFARDLQDYYWDTLVTPKSVKKYYGEKLKYIETKKKTVQDSKEKEHTLQKKRGM